MNFTVGPRFNASSFKALPAKESEGKLEKEEGNEKKDGGQYVIKGSPKVSEGLPVYGWQDKDGNLWYVGGRSAEIDPLKGLQADKDW